MRVKLGRGSNRQSIRRALARGGALTVSYRDVLEASHIREALAGVHAAGDPAVADPLLAYLASHPNSPEDVLVDLARSKSREILVSLAMNPRLPRRLQRVLERHPDAEVRERLRPRRPSGKAKGPG